MTTPYSRRAAATDTSPSRTSRSTACGSRSNGSPQPPPPDVRMTARESAGTSWRTTSTLRNSASCGRLQAGNPAARPLCPPHSPHGGQPRRRVCHRFHLPERGCAPPPRLRSRRGIRPAPAESGRSARRSTTTGQRSSIVSIGALRTSPWQTDTDADRTVLEWPPAPAAAFDALHDEPLAGAGCSAGEDDRARRARRGVLRGRGRRAPAPAR